MPDLGRVLCTCISSHYWRNFVASGEKITEEIAIAMKNHG
jgi:hypothetical protein